MLSTRDKAMDIPNGAWVRFSANRVIQNAAEKDGQYIGIYYGSTSHSQYSPETRQQYAGRVFAVNKQGIAIRPGIPLVELGNIKRCTDPSDVPLARRQQMRPVSKWRPSWPATTE